jgi:hypothetical protein
VADSPEGWNGDIPGKIRHWMQQFRNGRHDPSGGSVKGIIFNLAEEVVSRAHGEDMWDEILDGAGVSGSYTSLGSYPDADLFAILTEAGRLLGADSQTMLRQVAEGAMPLLANRYPHFFEPHQDTCSFVLTLNDIIHPEVRKLYPGADVPTFTFDQRTGNTLTMGYASARRLCILAEGFVTGAARHYGQQVKVEQPACMLRGDDTCVLYCEFSDAVA